MGYKLILLLKAFRKDISSFFYESSENEERQIIQQQQPQGLGPRLFALSFEENAFHMAVTRFYTFSDSALSGVGMSQH